MTLLIACPWCGPRDEPEFVCTGEPSARPTDTDHAGWADYLYVRTNVKGWHCELWCHRFGCGQWFVVERDTLTHAVAGTRVP